MTTVQKCDYEIAKDFPIGCRVVLPTGATGCVKGYVSTGRTATLPERLHIVYDPGIDNHFRTKDEVVLVPWLVKKLEGVRV